MNEGVVNMSKHYCPICNSELLKLRHEATFVYSYTIDDDAPGLRNHDVFKSFQYDKREQTDSKEYIECETCGSKYPTNFLFHILEKNERDEIK